jgi:hypothetical protein
MLRYLVVDGEVSPAFYVTDGRVSCGFNFVVSESMTKAIRDSKKSPPKMGRPITTGPGEPQVVRMHDEQLEAIDDWIEAHGEKISRPEAIRRLVEIGLKVKGK